MAVKNIIFDLGGVFLDIDYQRTRNAFIQNGVVNFDDFYQQSHVSPIFGALERGLVEPDEFYEGFRKESGVNLSDEQIMDSWNAMLADFRPNALAILQPLKLNYKTYLLSNTNSIHFSHFLKAHLELTGAPFDEQFHHAYYSHLIKQRKPDAASYLYITEQNGLLPEETLFIDDTYKNIEGAKAVNMQTLWLEPGMKLEEELPQYLKTNS
jgi:HAD superfamily hydrolase (TIGR01509 family)